MKKLIVKQYRGGEFVKIATYDINDIQQIQICSNRVNFVLQGHIKTYGDDCVIEFE